MTGDEHIIQEGRLLLHWGPLDPECFDRAKTWCEYYEPTELDHMISWGASMAWLRKHLVDRLDGTNDSAWYAPANDLAVPTCEIMAIHAHFQIGGIEMAGYLTVSQGEITSGTIFLEEKPNLILSLAEDFDEYNHADLERLARKHRLPRERLIPIRYEARGKNPFGIGAGILDIPMSPARTAPDDE